MKGNKMKNKSNGLRIKQAEAIDLPLITEFYQRHFSKNNRLTDPQLRNWEFFETPYSKCGKIPFYIIRNDTEVLGAVGAIASKIIIDNKEYNALHPVNFFVHDDYKGLYAYRLFKKLLEHSDIHYASYVSDSGNKFLNSLGFKNFNKEIKMLLYPIKSTKKNTPIQLMVANYRYFLSLRNKAIKHFNKLKNENYKFKKTISIEDGTIPENKKSNNKEPIYFIKSYQHLKWRYEKSPTINCIYFTLTLEKKPKCLVIAKEIKEKREIIILESIYEDRKYLHMCLHELVNNYKKSEYELITIICLGDKIKSDFMMNGFSKQQCNYKFLYYAKSPELMEKMSSSKKWRFTTGDTDIYL